MSFVGAPHTTRISFLSDTVSKAKVGRSQSFQLTLPFLHIPMVHAICLGKVCATCEERMTGTPRNRLSDEDILLELNTAARPLPLVEQWPL